MPLDDAPVAHPPVFDDTPIEVLFAIFAASRTAQEHDDRAV
jgi:hypothetical protein